MPELECLRVNGLFGMLDIVSGLRDLWHQINQAQVTVIPS